MLTRLSVRGFQSLADVTIELAPFTVVVGPSNSGKSAMRRALVALSTNAPASGRLRDGATTIEVLAELDDGSSVLWEKGPKRNAYTVQLADGDVLVQDKPGAKITPEAAEVLALDALNFADQFDPPYLLAETPGSAAKALGALTNVATLYDGIREASRRQRAHEARGRTLQGELELAEAELASYAHLPAEGQHLATTAELLAAAKEANDTYASLFNALAGAERFSETITAATAALATTVDPEPLLAELDAVLELLRTAAATTAAADQADHLAQRLLADLPPEPAWDDLLLPAAERAAAYAVALQSEALIRDAIGAAVQTAEAAEAELATVEAELAAIDQCPLCGSIGGVHA